jgi:hypothetical protein
VECGQDGLGIGLSNYYLYKNIYHLHVSDCAGPYVLATGLFGIGIFH